MPTVKEKINKEILPYEFEFELVDANLIQHDNNLGHNLVVYKDINIYGDDIYDIKYDPSVKKADKLDYVIAASSGFLTAIFNHFWVGDLSLKDAREWGSEKTDKFVVKVAQLTGYKGNSVAGAIRHLEKEHPIASDKLTDNFGGGRQHHLRDFAHHASIVGLAFSLLSQFTGSGYGTDTNGHFKSFKIPDTKLIGSTFVEKLFFGTFKWAMHLISDMHGSSNNPGAGTGIPGPLLSFLKTLSAIPLFKNLKINYLDDKLDFSIWVSKLFNGTHYYLNSEGKRVSFDLRTEIGVFNHIGKTTVPVIANEVIVRFMYFIRTLSEEIEDKEVRDFKQLKQLDPNSFLPVNNRRLNRMLTISSGVFFTVTTANVTARHVLTKGLKGSVPFILININYFGLGRFALAVKADWKYIVDDFDSIKNEYLNRQYAFYDEINLEIINKVLTLNHQQIRILHGLKYLSVKYDIEKTKNNEKRDRKIQWLHEWNSKMLNELNVTDDTFVLKDSFKLYKLVTEENSNNNAWITLITLEIMQFNMYYRLEKDSSTYDGLKQNYNYFEDVFLNTQSWFNKTNTNKIIKTFKQSVKIIKNRNKRLLIGAGGMLAAGIATGGTAYLFAPEIAVMLAGGSLSSLKGIALTNASLALLGGGSLAAGGLGMAGGTAFIAGGGTLLGGAVVGSVSLTTYLNSQSSDYALYEASKLLAYIKLEVLKMDNPDNIIFNIYKGLLKQINLLNKELDNTFFVKENKKKIKNLQESIKYLERASKSIYNLIGTEHEGNETFYLTSS